MKIIVNLEESILQIENPEGKLLFQVGIDKSKGMPINSGDIKVQYIPEQFDSDDK